MIRKTKKIIEDFSEYRDWKAGDIKAQWSGDDATHTLRLLKVYREQLSRGNYELTIQPDIPDFTKELARLERRAIWYRVLQGTGGMGIGGSVICEGVSYDFKTDWDKQDACIRAAWKASMKKGGEWKKTAEDKFF